MLDSRRLEESSRQNRRTIFCNGYSPAPCDYLTTLIHLAKNFPPQIGWNILNRRAHNEICLRQEQPNRCFVRILPSNLHRPKYSWEESYNNRWISSKRPFLQRWIASSVLNAQWHNLVQVQHCLWLTRNPAEQSGPRHASPVSNFGVFRIGLLPRRELVWTDAFSQGFLAWTNSLALVARGGRTNTWLHRWLGQLWRAISFSQISNRHRSIGH